MCGLLTVLLVKLGCILKLDGRHVLSVRQETRAQPRRKRSAPLANIPRQSQQHAPYVRMANSRTLAVRTVSLVLQVIGVNRERWIHVKADPGPLEANQPVLYAERAINVQLRVRLSAIMVVTPPVGLLPALFVLRDIAVKEGQKLHVK